MIPVSPGARGMNSPLAGRVALSERKLTISRRGPAKAEAAGADLLANTATPIQVEQRANTRGKFLSMTITVIEASRIDRRYVDLCAVVLNDRHVVLQSKVTRVVTPREGVSTSS